MVTERVKKEIRQTSSDNEESCGLILFKKDYFTYPCRNNSDNRRNFFSIHPFDYIRAEAQGEIIACYHTHLENAEFGDFDKENAKLFNIPFLLYIKPADDFKLFYPNEYQNPYVGRDYQIGESDCYSLFKEYYQKEFNIYLPEFSRSAEWETETPRLFEENYPKYGFKEAIPAEIKKGDGILFKYKETSPACHIGIYLADETFLHHPPNRFSLIEQYTNAYKRRTKHIIRKTE
jgi:proteasome lid subunit RPN8/RPN11